MRTYYNNHVFLRYIVFIYLIFLFYFFPDFSLYDVSAGEMSMTAIYAGRGDCILIESNEHYMLVDSGVKSESDNIILFLKNRGITKFDYVVATHPDGDHVGGFGKIFEAFEVGEVFYSPCPKKIASYYNFVEAVQNEHCPYSNPKTNSSFTLGDATVTFLYDGTLGSTYNESSLVIKVCCDNRSILLMGDLPSTIEQLLISMHIDFKCDVLKVGHHGAALSTCDDFLDACSPKMAVISSDKTSLLLPRTSVLRRLSMHSIKVYRTSNANVVIKFKNGKIKTKNKAFETFLSVSKANSNVSNNIPAICSRASSFSLERHFADMRLLCFNP